MIFRTEIIEYDLSFDKYRETRNLPLSYRLRLYLYNGELTLKNNILSGVSMTTKNGMNGGFVKTILIYYGFLL